jgi:hypothetical protein
MARTATSRKRCSIDGIGGILIACIEDLARQLMRTVVKLQGIEP